MLQSCWEAAPEDRPKFSSIVARLGTLIENYGHPGRDVAKSLKPDEEVEQSHEP